MASNTDQIFPAIGYFPQAVSETVAAFRSLGINDQLTLLGTIYQMLGCSLTPVTPGTARLFLTQGLLHRIKQMSHTEQLSAIYDILGGADTPITRQYGMFAPNTKLAFWYQLFEWMSMGEVVPLVIGSSLSPSATRLLAKIVSLDYSAQIEVVSQVIVEMGVAPLAA
ncbi:MAG TPA: orange carotenoid protein N-terminal domain-containing protein [Cyanophyceae cyanobacterium]